MKKLSLILLFIGTFTISAQAKAEIQCKLAFNINSWSVIYKSGKGSGTISCDNGETFPVIIRAHGGGITFGKSKIKGHGNFTGVEKTSELFGSYATAEAHGGIVKSGKVEGLTKGRVSLSLSGTGQGFDLGIAFGSFKIKRVN